MEILLLPLQDKGLFFGKKKDDGMQNPKGSVSAL